jgi:hypothetical protein
MQRNMPNVQRAQPHNNVQPQARPQISIRRR